MDQLRERFAPLVIRPDIYELPGLPVRWYWCRLGEVCTTVTGVIRRLGGSFNPTPEELIQAFALAARPVKWPEGKSAKITRRRIFRYATGDGRSLGMATETVPESTNGGAAPSFVLCLTSPCTADLFVPEGWVIDVMKMVRYGAVRIRFAAVISGKRELICDTFDGGICIFDKEVRLKRATDQVRSRLYG